jgi:hypothetical protein
VIGKTKCAACAELVPVKEQANGLACYACPWCSLFVQAHGPEADAFIRKGTQALAPGEAAPGERPASAKRTSSSASSPASAPSSSAAKGDDEQTIFDLLTRGRKAKAAT